MDEQTYTLAIGEQLTGTLDALAKAVDFIGSLAERGGESERRVTSLERVVAQLSDLHP